MAQETFRRLIQINLTNFNYANLPTALKPEKLTLHPHHADQAVG
jgi:hypothetical protein